MLLIAAVVAMLTRRLRLPYSVGLVAAGIGLAALPFAPKVTLTKDLIFTALLPPLLFEAAFYIDWNQLRRDFSVIVVLATLGVILSACVTAIGMHYLAHWQWLGAVVFGVLIAATDPVSALSQGRGTIENCKACCSWQSFLKSRHADGSEHLQFTQWWHVISSHGCQMDLNQLSNASQNNIGKQEERQSIHEAQRDRNWAASVSVNHVCTPSR